MSQQTYFSVVNRLRVWKDVDHLDVDWSYPTGSIGDHLCVLLGYKNITDLMKPDASSSLQQLLGDNGYFIYKTLVAQQIPQN